MTDQIQKYNKQGLEVLGTTEEMKARLDLNGERLKLVHEFIDEGFREGIDYGPADPRNPKKTLLKPGAERICKLFNTRPRWRMDEDTWKMLGSPAGTVCYLCEIVDNTTGEVIGEGRGAERVGNVSRDANKSIKIAEKCAIVDAALYTFGLSELFTQDGPPKKDLDTAKSELTSMVEGLRNGIDSKLTNNRFIHAVISDVTKGSTLQTIGAVKAVRKAITDGLYDLATGERVRFVPQSEMTSRDVHAELDQIAKRLWGPTKFLDELDSACHAAGYDLEKLTDDQAVRMIAELSGQSKGGK